MVVQLGGGASWRAAGGRELAEEVASGSERDLG